MRTIHNYKLEEETWEEQSKAGRFNAATVIVYRDKTGKHRNTIGAGHSDTIKVYREGEVTYVLSFNYGMQYAGIQAFSRGSECPGTPFFQDVREQFGKDFLDMSGMHIVKTLAQYVSFE